MEPLPEPRRFEPFRYMRYAKHHVHDVGFFLAQSAVPLPDDAAIGLLPEDFKTTPYAGFFGHPRATAELSRRFSVNPLHIVMTAGTSEALALVCMTLLNPGDDVLAETPGYELFRRAPALYHARCLPLPRPEEQGFLPDLADFRARLTPKTRLVILSNLHNPTGAGLPPDLLKNMIVAAREKGAYVFVDEVYLDYLPPGGNDPTSYHYGDNVIVGSSLTKAYGLGEHRFGWCFAPRAVAERMLDVIDIVNPGISNIAQNIGYRALLNLERLRPRTREYFERNFPILLEWTRTRPGVSLFQPLGAACIAVKIEGVEDSYELAEYLHEKHRVTISPGAAFDMPSWIRVGITTPPEYLRAGLDALGRGIDAWRRERPQS